MFKAVKAAVKEQQEIINENIRTIYIKYVLGGCLFLMFGLKCIIASIVSSFNTNEGFMARLDIAMSFPVMFTGIVLTFVSYIYFQEALKIDITKHFITQKNN